MKFDYLLSAAVTVCIALSGHAAIAQTANEAVVSENTSLDPELRNRKRCVDHHGRPQWMIEQPLGFEWRLELGRNFRSVQRSRMVSETDTCNCDTLYPDWNIYRAELEAIWNEASLESKFVWNDETRDRYNAARDQLTDVSRPLLPMVTRLCASVE